LVTLNLKDEEAVDGQAPRERTRREGSA